MPLDSVTWKSEDVVLAFSCPQECGMWYPYSGNTSIDMVTCMHACPRCARCMPQHLNRWHKIYYSTHVESGKWGKNLQSLTKPAAMGSISYDLGEAVKEGGAALLLEVTLELGF